MAKVTYCSFADEKCFGVVVLLGEHSPTEAAALTRAMSLNPGGQLAAIAFDTDDQDVPRHVAQNLLAHTGRLISVDEAIRLFEAEGLDEALRAGELTQEQANNFLPRIDQ